MWRRSNISSFNLGRIRRTSSTTFHRIYSPSIPDRKYNHVMAFLNPHCTPFAAQPATVIPTPQTKTIVSPKRYQWQQRQQQQQRRHAASSSSSLASSRPLSSNDTNDNSHGVKKKKKSTIFSVGDTVLLTDVIMNEKEKITLSGVIECKKGGWYTVAIHNDNKGRDGTTTLVKRRANQLTLVEEAGSNPKEEIFNTRSSTSTDVELPVIFNKTKELPQTPLPPPPTIHNLDAAILTTTHSQDAVENIMDAHLLKHYAQHHYKVTKWVTFSDLHCSSSSLSTCLKLLDFVHNQALRIADDLQKKDPNEKVGILFLGDFWHHRRTLRVDCLNAILQSLSQWKVPMLCIPGNHDQITLSGHEHALTPLTNAYTLQTSSSSSISNNYNDNINGPGLLIFSHPTKFQNALFVPHIRNIAIMQSVLQAPISTNANTTKAMLIHADVTGAYMNDMILSQGGVSPCYFPPNIPIYSGHFHKPHVVKSTKNNVEIRYVGSPYQTTLSEACQKKSLLVLDPTQDWKCTDEISIPKNIGKQHFSCKTIDEFLNISNNDIQPGDRIVMTIAQEEWEKYYVKVHNDENKMISDINNEKVFNNIDKSSTEIDHTISPLDEKIKLLKSSGVSVEVRQVKSIPEYTMLLPLEEQLKMRKDIDNRNTWKKVLMEDLSPKAIFSSYLNGELSRAAMTNTSASSLLDAGTTLLDDDLETDDDITDVSSSINPVDLTLDSISVQGLGPFKEPVTYPLNGRGMVLLRGKNEDGGADSNGSGKTTLAMSALWALTGSVDPRPIQDSKVADIIHDKSKVATVTLHGTINGSKYTIMRSKSSNNKGSLTFHVDRQDLTTQSAKETQLLINEIIGSSQILSRSIFHGQHSINGLLEATDAKFKEELSLVVPLTMWQNAAKIARSKGRQLSKKGSEIEGMLQIRMDDSNLIKINYELAKKTLQSKESAYNLKKNEIQLYLNQLQENINLNENRDLKTELSNVELEVEQIAKNLDTLESNLEKTVLERNKLIRQLREELDEKTNTLKFTRMSLENAQRVVDRSEMSLSSSKSHLSKIQRKWNISGNDIDLSSFEIKFIAPSICPTCNQPITNEDEHEHSHESLGDKVKKEFREILETIDQTSNEHNNNVEKYSAVEQAMKTIELEHETKKSNLKRMEKVWDHQLDGLQSDIRDTRKRQNELSKLGSKINHEIRKHSDFKAIESTKMGELTRMKDAVDIAQSSFKKISLDFEDMKGSIQKLEEEKHKIENESNTMTKLTECFGPRGVQSFVLQNAIQALQISAQSYLDVLSDKSLLLNIMLDSSDRVLRTVSTLNSDGSWVERPLSSLSGGQWRRCSLALNLGFSDLVAKRGKLRTSLLVLDEPLTHLDSTGRAQVGHLLRRILQDSNNERDESIPGKRKLGIGGLDVSTIIIILQDLAAEELEESFDSIDEVVKTSGSSRVVLDDYNH